MNDIDTNSNQFKYACGNNKLAKAKWLLFVDETIDISIDDDYAFRKSCEHGHLDVAKWLLSLSNNYTTIRTKYTMQLKCKFPNKLSWLHPKNEKLNDKFLSAFRSSCLNEQIEVAKWLVSIDNSIISTIDKYFFGIISSLRNIELLKWLLSIAEFPNNLTLDFAFQCSCQSGHIEITKWLLSIEPNEIDISIDNDHAFRKSCEHGHNDIMALLMQHSKKYSYLELNGSYVPIININIIIDLSISTVIECPVCCVSVGNNKTNCGHHFCSDCV
jgi:hypothetical protein